MRSQGVAIAILNMGIRLRLGGDGTVESIRIAVGPAGPRPFRARAAEQELLARVPDDAALRTAAEALRREAEFRTSPHRSTAEYRRHLGSILLERTLHAALDRARAATGALP
jgi:CO/xanthine dehydrogenase FAD-binding subunit